MQTATRRRRPPPGTCVRSGRSTLDRCATAVVATPRCCRRTRSRSLPRRCRIQAVRVDAVAVGVAARHVEALDPALPAEQVTRGTGVERVSVQASAPDSRRKRDAGTIRCRNPAMRQIEQLQSAHLEHRPGVDLETHAAAMAAAAMRDQGRGRGVGISPGQLNPCRPCHCPCPCRRRALGPRLETQCRGGCRHVLVHVLGRLDAPCPRPCQRFSPGVRRAAALWDAPRTVAPTCPCRDWEVLAQVDIDFDRARPAVDVGTKPRLRRWNSAEPGLMPSSLATAPQPLPWLRSHSSTT